MNPINVGGLAQDSERFKYKNNLILSNANMYISNNNNPFLISPYTPNTNAASKATVDTISSIVSSLIGGLSSILDINTYTLSISNIKGIAPANTLTIIGDNVNINTPQLQVSGDAIFNSLLTVSSISTTNFSFSTLNGNIGTFNTLTINSTLNASTISTTIFSFSTLNGNIGTFNTLNVNSTLNGSTINTTSLNTSTLSFSSLTGTISSSVSVFNSSLVVNIEGVLYKIPLAVA